MPTYVIRVLVTQTDEPPSPGDSGAAQGNRTPDLLIKFDNPTTSIEVR
jgi:hypothetical protein